MLLSNSDFMYIDQGLYKYTKSEIGGKGYGLQMVSGAASIPYTVVVPSKVYQKALDECSVGSVNLRQFIHDKWAEVDTNNRDSIVEFSESVRRVIIDIDLTFSGVYLSQVGIVRSSGVDEDGDENSFAGQHDSVIGVTVGNISEAIKTCWASLYNIRAIEYRLSKGLDIESASMAVLLQELIRPTTSHVIFTYDPVLHGKNNIVIESIWGLGELLVSGKVTPTITILDISSGNVVAESLSTQEQRLDCALSGRLELKYIDKKTPAISKTMAETLKFSIRSLIEKCGNNLDIEAAVVGNFLYVLQVRPITSNNFGGESSTHILEEGVRYGLGASNGVASGKVHKVNDKMINSSRVAKKMMGQILVSRYTSPNIVGLMKQAKGIVTEVGGVTCHAAIVSRELGVPCVVGVNGIMGLVEKGDVLEVNGNEGKVRKVEK